MVSRYKLEVFTTIEKSLEQINREIICTPSGPFTSTVQKSGDGADG